MPSDSKKRKDAKKKETAKQRGQKKPGNEDEVTNGHGDSAENGTANGVSNGALNGLAEQLEGLDLAAEFRSCTGVLSSHPDSRDVHISGLSITFHGAELLSDTKLELNVGRRYGLIGLNGCGKSTLLACISSRELPIPEHVDIYLLRREMAPSDETALQSVIECDEERLKLEKEAEILASRPDQESHERLMDVYEHLDEMDATTAEARAAEILYGLGFTKEMQYTAVKDFSGGWRMRIALARALYIKPALLMLDEPTNHLDLDACVWLEQELAEYKRILVVISHSQDFMNGVCNSIVHMNLKKLKYYGGNYDAHIQTRFELEENQMKRFRWEQDQISNMKNYIARFGHGSAKLARQAQSKEKTLKKMVDGGLTEKVSADKTLTFYFPPCGKLPPPIIMVQHVSFRYADDKKWIYRNLDFGIDLDTRIALVGPNGAGKSTLLKLIIGELHPTDGLIRRHSHVKIGRYHQHMTELLDMEMSAMDWLMKAYPDVKEREEMRRNIGMYGLTGQQQVVPMKNLSDGQRCRVIFAYISWQNPHMLLFDEPTNHLDIETIDALAEAINDFEGGMILVSHDFRLISQVTETIWVCEKEAVTRWEGDIFSYKENLRKKLEKDRKKRQKALANMKN